MARFDYNSKCANSTACRRLMAEFVSNASDLTTEIEIEGTGLSVENPRPVRLKEGQNGFCAYVDSPAIFIEYDYKSVAEGGDGNKDFRRNVVMRAPAMNGFADITLALLHELGHFETEEELPFGYDRFKAEEMCKEWCGDDYEKLNLMYFTLPDEWLATQWAIEWLSDDDNRKIAKQFEREFFKAWRGR